MPQEEDDIDDTSRLVSAVDSTRVRVLSEVTPRIPWPRTEHVDFDELVRRRRRRGEELRMADALWDRGPEVRALVQLTAEKRGLIEEVLLDVAAATTRFESVLETLENQEIDLVNILSEYLGLLLIFIETQDQEIRESPKDFLLQNFSSEWSGILSVEKVTTNTLRVEAICAFIATACIQGYMARFTVDSILNKMNVEFIAQKEMDNALIAATKLYRQGAGIAHQARTWATEQEINFVMGIGAVQDICKELADNFLICAQTLCAGTFACKNQIKDLKMAALLCETAAMTISHRNLRLSKRERYRNGFPKDASAVLLGFYYLYLAEAAVLEHRRGPWSIYLWLNALCFRQATSKHSTWLHLQPLIKSEDHIKQMSRDLPDDAFTWRHRWHDRILGIVVSIIDEPVGNLVVEAVPLELRLSDRKADISERKKVVEVQQLAKKSIIRHYATVAHARDVSQTRQTLAVEPWKYGIERLRACHHRLEFDDDDYDGDDDINDEAGNNAEDIDEEILRTRQEETIVKSPVTPSKRKSSLHKNGHRRHISFVQGQGARCKPVPMMEENINQRSSSLIGLRLDDDKQENEESEDEYYNPSSPEPRLPAASYIHYDAFTGTRERVFAGKSPFRPKSSHEIEKLIKERSKVPCGLCEHEYPVDQLISCATKRGISKIKTMWGAFQKDSKVRAHALVHTSTKVCVFCEQFFTVPFEMLKPPHRVEKTVLRPTETQQDRDIETMILESIQSMNEDNFQHLSADQRQGIFSGTSALSKLPSDAINLAVNRFASQSSTHDKKYCALNAVDDNLFGAPAKTAKETEPWWQLDLGVLANIHSIRLWTGEQRLRARIVHVLIARTSFSEKRTLSQAVEHAHAHYRFAFSSRVLEWCPQLRGRFVRVQLEAIDEQLSLVQCQVFGQRVMEQAPIATSTQVSPLNKRPSLTKSHTSAPMQELSSQERVEAHLKHFRFNIENYPRLKKPDFTRVCMLIHIPGSKSSKAKKTEAGSYSAWAESDVESLLQDCKTGYQDEAVFEEFLKALEETVHDKIQAHLSSLDSLQDMRGLALRDRHRSSLGTADSGMLATWQFEQLLKCFTQLLAPRLRDNIRSPQAKIESERVAELFRVGKPGYQFAKDCTLTSNAANSGKLCIASGLLAKIEAVTTKGLDWSGFLLFALCWEQLMQAQRMALRDTTPSATCNTNPLQRPQSAPAIRTRTHALHDDNSFSANLLRDSKSPKSHRQGKLRLPSRLAPLAPREDACAVCGFEYKLENLTETLTPDEAREKLSEWRHIKNLDSIGIDKSNVTELACRVSQSREIRVCSVCALHFNVPEGKLAQQIHSRYAALRHIEEDPMEACLERLGIKNHELRTVRQLCRSVGISLIKAQTRIRHWRDLNRVSKLASVASLRLQWWWRSVRLRWARAPRPPPTLSCEKQMELTMEEMENLLAEQMHDEHNRRYRAWRNM